MSIKHKPIERTSHVFPDELRAELLRLYRISPDWLDLRVHGVVFECRPLVHTWLEDFMRSRTGITSADLLGMWALSNWIGEGPKVFRPTPMQCQALENVEVRLSLEEYAQPYKAICVELPIEIYHPFNCVVCMYNPRMSVFNIVGPCHHYDTVTTISTFSSTMEESIVKFDKSCEDSAEMGSRCLRVAINSCLALVNYGHHMKLLFPHEEARDRRLAEENSDRGKKAKDRLSTHLSLVSFNQEIKLHNTEGRTYERSDDVEPTGREMLSHYPCREMPTHWRKGCWCMQPYGPSQSLRKRILRKPCFVRADKFLGDKSDTSVTYK